MVKLQIVKRAEDSAPMEGCRCTVSCCVDNDYGHCTSRPYSAKVCSEPCAMFVQVTSNCAAMCKSCSCKAG